jgi:hypothetical protein
MTTVTMPAPHLTHDIVCVGSHEPHQHEFHAANAHAVHDLFTSGLAPARSIATCLAGARVTVSAVASALESAADRGATNHVVYFSGRGSAGGLEVSNGAITAEMLDRHLAHARAHAVLLILDLAVGAEPDAALLPGWLQHIVARRSNTRVAVARATRIGTGVDGAGLGRFTAAFVAALETAPGDLRVERGRFISDKQAIERARFALGERWGMTNFPFQLGTFGDMPLARSQVSSTVGSGSLLTVVPGAGLSASVTWILEGRANMKTSIHYAMESADGVVLGSGWLEVVAKNPLQKGKTRVRLSKSMLVPPAKASSLRPLDLSWRVSLRDCRGRVLAERLAVHR